MRVKEEDQIKKTIGLISEGGKKNSKFEYSSFGNTEIKDKKL